MDIEKFKRIANALQQGAGSLVPPDAKQVYYKFYFAPGEAEGTDDAVWVTVAVQRGPRRIGEPKLELPELTGQRPEE